jgi:Uma2 family endonuclease
VAEIRSGDQSMQSLKDKMDEYMDCGCRLGWLIDPADRQTWVYAENADPQVVPFDAPLSGGDVMPGFELRMADIF